MTDFTPLSAMLGGLLIGLSAALLLWFNGRIAGISGIVNGALGGGERGWRWWFLAGLVLGGGSYIWITDAAPFRTDFPPGLIVLAGLLVGFGTRMGSGCTSGHGVCGLARLSMRSLVATLTFLAAGIIATFISRHLLGVPL